MFIVDGHCDTIQIALDRGVDLEDKSQVFLGNWKCYKNFIEKS